jgi:SAM-dependent methyltransferase
VGVDVRLPRAKPDTYLFALYDGVSLPVRDGAVDVVFSSSVLEHIPRTAIDGLLREQRRVLDERGVIVHIVPSVSWRALTSVTSMLDLGRYALRRALLRRRPQTVPVAIDPTQGADDPADRRGSRLHSAATLLSRALHPGPHGEYRSAVAELVAYSRIRWRQVFERSGFRIVWSGGNGLAYSGVKLWPGLSMRARGRLHLVTGSSCHVFVLRPSDA